VSRGGRISTWIATAAENLLHHSLEDAMNQPLVSLLATIGVATLSACIAGDGSHEEETKSSLVADEARADPQTPPPPPPCPEVMAPPASECEGGTWVETENDAGCPTFECVPCPPIAAPPPGFCPDGVVVESRNAAGCVDGFECVVCPPVMAPPQSECEGGTWVETTNAAGCVDGFECVL
jgi:hypothetical protein